jgi:diguanylate cyclase (GGDEF)-like protein/PAS domain S-box-containing protein
MRSQDNLFVAGATLLANAAMAKTTDPELFRAALEQNDFGVVITDIEGGIEYVNPYQSVASGYALAELIGRNIGIFQPEDLSADAVNTAWPAILTMQVWHGELNTLRKNGKLVRQFVQVSPIRDKSDIARHFFVTLQEIRVSDKAVMAQEVLASLDVLTGLPNRAAAMARMGEIIADCRSGERELALLYVDLDRFKSFNETLGHLSADRVLIEAVQRIRRAIRHDDEFARIGSDEFVILLRGDFEQTQCTEAVGRLLAAIRQPLSIDDHEFVLTASIGIARYPIDGEDAQTLLRNADIAMSFAKRDGGDAYHFYDHGMDTGAGRRLDLSSQLRNVVERGELLLHYQPQVSLFSGAIVGLEALVRWQHPQRGLLPPGMFIPLAEETGMIVAIGDWVLREAVTQAIKWQAAGLPAIKVAVNLSARHFRHSELPEMIASLLAESGLQPALLELELTESTMMRDIAQVIRIIERLKKLGVRLALDDFGTGYSSLSYLSRLPVDLLKIDQSFVTANPINASIATATIAMAHKLGKRVVAEGVETEAQMSFLRRHECDEMQGFLFNRPCAADEIATMLREERHQQFAPVDDSAAQPTLLLVDDEPNILSALNRLFRREGYRVLMAGSGRQALELLAANPVQVIISDQRMAEMSGVELLSRVKDIYPDTVRIVLSGYAELSTVTDAVNRGAIWKYFAKPWDDEVLREEVRRAFRRQAGDPKP